MNYTKGPWKLNTRSIVPRVICDSKGEQVAVATANGSSVVSNARLISAAPDLYEACKAALETHDNPNLGWTLPDWMETLFRAAIRKAEEV